MSCVVMSPQVDKAYYSEGLLLLSDVRERDPNANLVLVCSAPP